MAKSRVKVEMAVRWWVGVPEPDLVVEPNSVVESSPFLHCTGCVDVVVVMWLAYEL
jgi:hypothetical protein